LEEGSPPHETISEIEPSREQRKREGDRERRKGRDRERERRGREGEREGERKREKREGEHANKTETMWRQTARGDEMRFEA
jgi:hypothetical protein